ncbi:Protein FAM90A1 [Sciurus carolinensis]|uniref:Protein FAM90A1 n=1 Tax=Sciurus carolinensis TaxID=30640 RepID=A0AA41T8Y6_SCICA|nr:Protein FAM90A1 [Sciurus carolinensis]
MRQWEGHSSQPPSQRLIKTQTDKLQQRRAVGQRATPLEEENPQVKCKDCGAFGHTSRSRRCPMKCWDGALAPQHLGPKKEKKNQTPRQLETLHDTESFKQLERRKDQGQRQEEQPRKSLLQRIPRRLQGRQQPNWEERKESSASLRQTSRPSPIQIPCKSSVLGPALESQPPVKNTDERPILPTGKLFQRNERDFYSIPVPMKGQEVAITGTSQPAVRWSGQNTALHVKGADEKPLLQATAWRAAQVPTLSVRAPIKRHAQDPVKTSQHAPKKLRGNPSLTPYWSTESPGVEVYTSVQCLPSTSGLRFKVSPHMTRKTPPHGSSMDLHSPRKSPVLNPVPPCTKSNPPAASCVPRQTLRMVFMRLHHDCWSSRFIMTPPSSPPSKPNAPAMSAPFLDKSKGHSSHVPVSCLYEDIQVSSSSEDSDME